MSIEVTPFDGQRPASVLIVEDEGVVAKHLQNSLQSLGYAVLSTSDSGPDAILRAERLHPDVVLMDIRLNGEMDGIEAARRIRERQDVPVVFLTAHADPKTLARAASVGPYAYVLKPYDDHDLHVALTTAMHRHRAFAQLDRRVREQTEQLARTRSKYRRLESVAEFGLYALGTRDTDRVMRKGVSLVAEALSVEFVKVLQLLPDGTSFLLRAGVGWKDDRVGRAIVSSNSASQSDDTLAASEPVVVADLRREPSFKASSLLTEHGVQSGMSIVIHAPGPHGRPYGVLGAYSREPRRYTDNDVNFLQAVGNVLATVILRSAADEEVLTANRTAQEERVRASLAQEALRTRDEFLSVASHELRTPVAALQLQLEALRELLARQGATTDPRILERTERAGNTCRRLASLVEGVLDVSRIALGSLELVEERFDLAALVRDLAARQQELAARAGCRLEVSVCQPVCGSWDRLRLEQVLTNLLSNAFKFGAGKPVELELERDGAEAKLTVRDFGKGIDPGDAERILGRFERAVSHRHYGGLGLGLYIAGQIVQQHRGRLEVDSKPGDGAAFTVVLPCDSAC